MTKLGKRKKITHYRPDENREGNAPSAPADIDTFEISAPYNLTNELISGIANDIADGNQEGNAPSASVHRDILELSGTGNLRDDFIPGIPNDIAWQVIAPKLSGTDVNTLSKVSLSWLEAIHRRWVYDLKVRSHSTETFVVVLYYRGLYRKWDYFRSSYPKGVTFKLCLYPLNDCFAYDLPSIPCPEVFCLGCKCITLDGRIYILGGAIPGLGTSPYLESCSGSRKVFMLGLAGHKQWKQCASMQDGRHHFGAGVLDGKIYVVGGRNSAGSVQKCEVYDPKVDQWSSIGDLIPLPMEIQVAAIGRELFVYGRMYWAEDRQHRKCSRCVLAYNPVKNEWRKLGHFDNGNNPWVQAFVARGKFYTMTRKGIDVYDMDTNSWSSLHEFLQRTFLGFETLALHSLLTSYHGTTWALDDEVLTLSNYSDTIFMPCGKPTPRVTLVQSKGFGSKNKAIVFKTVGNRDLKSHLEHLSGIWQYQLCLLQL